MKTFQYKLGDKQLTIHIDERRNTVAGIQVDDEAHQPTADEMPAYAAVIALALIEHEVEYVHDDETNIITVKRQPTAWNNPAKQMKSLK